MVLAMVLRRKPDVMISLLPTMKESQKYQGQDKLPVTVWVIAQVTVFKMLQCPHPKRTLKNCLYGFLTGF